ncbi:hypothetical protein BH11PSE11_BH11PSE11_17930 [soil metagenome]
MGSKHRGRGFKAASVSGAGVARVATRDGGLRLMAAAILNHVTGSYRENMPRTPSDTEPGSAPTRRQLSLSTRRYRSAARSFAFAASTSRVRDCALVTSEAIKSSAVAAMSSTARLKAASFALDGCVKPLSFRTNYSEASRISDLVAGGSKLKSVFMLRHMAIPGGYIFQVMGWSHGERT